MTYKEFLEGKIELAETGGFEIEPAELNNALKPHQKEAVAWAIRGGMQSSV